MVEGRLPFLCPTLTTPLQEKHVVKQVCTERFTVINFSKGSPFCLTEKVPYLSSPG